MVKPKARDSSINNLPSLDLIKQRIFLLGGQKVMLDIDLAALYGVPAFRLNEQVKRNRKRFPDNLMFRVTREETEVLTSQFAISNKGRGGRRYRVESNCVVHRTVW